MVREAKVFARPLKSAELEEGGARVELVDGTEDVGKVGDVKDDVSELYDCDLDEIGTVKEWRFCSEILNCESVLGIGRR